MFTIGDKVRVIRGEYRGKTGDVMKEDYLTAHVKFDEPVPDSYVGMRYPKNFLEKVEPESNLGLGENLIGDMVRVFTSVDRDNLRGGRYYITSTYDDRVEISIKKNPDLQTNRYWVGKEEIDNLSLRERMKTFSTPDSSSFDWGWHIGAGTANTVTGGMAGEITKPQKVSGLSEFQEGIKLFKDTIKK